MRIDLTDFDGNSVFAKYDEFNTGDERSNFKLTANGYSGTADKHNYTVHIYSLIIMLDILT